MMLQQEVGELTQRAQRAEELLVHEDLMQSLAGGKLKASQKQVDSPLAAELLKASYTSSLRPPTLVA
jgi:hypothetical protein